MGYSGQAPKPETKLQMRYLRRFMFKRMTSKICVLADHKNDGNFYQRALLEKNTGFERLLGMNKLKKNLIGLKKKIIEYAGTPKGL